MKINFFDAVYSILTWFLVHFLGYGIRLVDLTGLGLSRRWKPGEKLQVLFLAYSGARNTGAEVRVAECVDQVNKVLGEESIDINMTTLDMKEAREYFKGHRVNLFPMSPIFFWDVFRLVLKNHMVVLVEGSCWKENFASALLLYFLYGAGLAGILGKPCFSYAVDAGPMNRLNNFMSRSLSKRITRIIVRSEGAKKILDGMGLKGAIVRVDTAWSLRAYPMNWATKRLRRCGWDGKKPLVGLAMQNFFWWPVIPDFLRWIRRDKRYNYKLLYYYDYGPEDQERYREWAGTLAGLMDWIGDTYSAQVVLFAMEALDNEACRDVEKAMRNKPIIVSCNDFVGGEIASFLRNLNLLVTTRYHAMVLSMPQGIPFVGLSRDERIEGVMKECGLYADYYVDYSLPDLRGEIERRVRRLMEDEAERRRVSQVIRDHLPYYFSRMALLGLDIRRIVAESFPGINLKPLDEKNPEMLVPFIPPEIKHAVRKEFDVSFR